MIRLEKDRESYKLGFKNGKLVKLMGIRLIDALNSPNQHYAFGYRDGQNYIKKIASHFVVELEYKGIVNG